MTIATELLVNLKLVSSDFTKGIDDAGKKVGSFSNTLSTGFSGLGNLAGRVLAGGFMVATAGAVALGSELYKDVQAAIDAERVQAQLNAVLESTGGIAGITADEVNKYADARAKATGIDDEAIVSAESLLLTFTKIGKDVMPQVMDMNLDMATSLNGGLIPSEEQLRQNSIMLGKAMQDPISGMTALSRVGALNRDDFERLNKEWESGTIPLEQQQAELLAALSVEFKGSAEAAGKTFAGQLAILGIEVGNVRESIGTALLPTLVSMTTKIATFVSSDKFQAWLKKTISFVERAAQTFGYFISAIADGGLSAIFEKDNLGDSPLNTLLQLFGMTEESANKWAGYLQTAFNWVRDTMAWLTNAFENDKGLWVAVFAVLTAAVVAFVYPIIAAALPVIAVIALIGAAAYLLYTAWTQNWGGIQEKTAAVWAWLQPILMAVWTWLSVNVPMAIQAMVQWWSALWANIQAVWAGISAVVSAGINFIIAIFNAAKAGDWYQVGELMRKAWDTAMKLIVNAIKAGWSLIKSALTTVIKNAVNLITNTNWAAAGMNIMKALANGVASGAGVLYNAVVAAVKNALAAITGIIGGFIGDDDKGGGGAQKRGFSMAGGGAFQGFSGTTYPNIPATANANTGVVNIFGGNWTVERGGSFSNSVLGELKG